MLSRQIVIVEGFHSRKHPILTVFLMFLASQPTGGLLMGLPTTKVPSASWYLISPGSMRDLESCSDRG